MKTPTLRDMNNVIQKSTGNLYGIDQLEIASKEDPKQLKEAIDKLRSFKRNHVLHVNMIDLSKLKNKRNKDVKRKEYKKLHKQGFEGVNKIV